MFRTATLFSALVLLAGGLAPVSAQSPSKPLDPVGVYDLDLEREGQFTDAAMEIVKDTEGRLSATLQVHGQSISFERVKVEGNVVLLETGSSELSLMLTFKDQDTISGTWSRPEGNGGLAGVRRKG
jgi:hypothetical protein